MNRFPHTFQTVTDSCSIGRKHEIQALMEVEELQRVAATQELSPQLCRQRLPVSLVLVRWRALRPKNCHSIVRLVAAV